MTTLGDILIKVRLDSSGVKSGASESKKEMEGLSSSARSMASAFAEKFTSIGTSLKSFGSELTGIGAGISAAFAGPVIYAIKQASDLGESLNKTREVFGSASAAVESFATESATKLGLSKAAALDAAGGFGNLFTQLGIGKEKAAEMSTSIVSLAADFASFHNADISEVLNAQSAAFRGEYDSLQRFLPLISAATVEQEALAMTHKASNKELTAQEKALAVNALMFKGAGAAVGDFARTSDGMANVMRIVRAQLENLATEIGAEFLPYVQKALVLVRSWIQGFSELSPTVKTVIVSVLGFGAVLGPVLVGLGAVVTALGALISPAGLVVAAVAALATAFATNFGGIRDAVVKWVNEGKRYYQEHKEEIDALGKKVKEIFEEYIQELGKAAASLIKTLGDMKATIDSFSADNDGSWKAIVGIIKWFVMSLDAELKVVSKVINFLAEDFRISFGAIKKFIIEPIKEAIDWIQGASQDFLSAFTAITNAAKLGLVVHSPPIAAQWVMMIGEAAEASAKRVKSSSKEFQAGFEAISSSINRYLSETGKGFSLSKEALEGLLKIQPEVVKELYAQAKAHEAIIRNLEIYGALMLTAAGRNSEFATTIGRALGGLLQFDKALKQLLPIQREFANLGGEIKATTIITDKFGEAIAKSVGELAEWTIAAKKAGDAAQQLADDHFRSLSESAQELADKLPYSINSIFDAIANNTGKMGGDLLKFVSNLRGWATDIMGVFSVLPQGAQDAAQKVLGTLDKWFHFGDSVLNILNRMGIEVPATMTDLIGSMLQNLDFSSILDKVKGFGKSLFEGIQNVFKSGIGMIAGGVGLLAGSFGVGGAAGRLMGAGGGALLGAKFGSMIAPGIGTAIGAIGGAIFGGLFGGKKSKEQKEAEDNARKQAGLQTEQMINAVNQGILDTMSKGVDLLAKIEGFAEVPRKAIKRFVNQLTLVMQEFVEQSKSFKADSMAHAKAVTENLGGSIELMLGGAQLIEAIRATESLSSEKIKAFVDSAIKIIAAWTEAAAQIELGAAKFAGKLSEKLKSSFELLTMIPDTIKGLVEASAIELTDEQISRPIDMARKIIDKFFELTEEFRGYMLNKVTKTSEQFKTVFDAAKTIFESLNVIGNYKALPDAVFDTINSDFERVTAWLDGLLETVTDWLSKSEILDTDLAQFVANLNSGLSRIVTAAGGAASNSAAQAVTVQNAAASTSASRSAQSGTSITINGMQLNGDDPRTRAAVQALTELLGVGGGLEATVGSY